MTRFERHIMLIIKVQRRLCRLFVPPFTVFALFTGVFMSVPGMAGAADDIESSNQGGVIVGFGLGTSSGGGKNSPSSWLDTGSVVAARPVPRAPEINTAAAPGAISFLLGSLALMHERSRRRRR